MSAAVLEALAYGVPVLTNLASAAEYPEATVALLGELTPEATAGCLASLIADPARLAALMEQYRPQVVVTYDEYGFYGHPDHIKANQITMAAAETSGVPDKVYYTAIARSRLAAFAEVNEVCSEFFAVAP